MAELRTDYVDDVLDTSKNTIRKYKQIQNSDGTVSFVDVTEYLTVGTEFGAKDINDITKANNDLSEQINSGLSDTATGESFNYGVLDGVRGFYTNPSRADDCFVPFKSGIKLIASNLRGNTEHTIDVSKLYENYALLTASNFLIEIVSINSELNAAVKGVGNAKLQWTYANGKLSITKGNVGVWNLAATDYNFAAYPIYNVYIK